jgi:hypothetical protein
MTHRTHCGDRVNAPWSDIERTSSWRYFSQPCVEPSATPAYIHAQPHTRPLWMTRTHTAQVHNPRRTLITQQVTAQARRIARDVTAVDGRCCHYRFLARVPAAPSPCQAPCDTARTAPSRAHHQLDAARRTTCRTVHHRSPSHARTSTQGRVDQTHNNHGGTSHIHTFAHSHIRRFANSHRYTQHSRCHHGPITIATDGLHRQLLATSLLNLCGGVHLHRGDDLGVGEPITLALRNIAVHQRWSAAVVWEM